MKLSDADEFVDVLDTYMGKSFKITERGKAASTYILDSLCAEIDEDTFLIFYNYEDTIKPSHVLSIIDIGDIKNVNYLEDGIEIIFYDNLRYVLFKEL